MAKNSRFGPAREFLLKRSTVLFGALSLGIVIIKVGLQFLLTDLPLRDQASAFTWSLVLSIIAIGFLGLLADRASGFPDSLSDPQRDRRGIGIATITGGAYGLITIGMYVWHPMHSPLNPSSGWDHVPLPWSIPFYTFGAIFLEYLLRLGALCISFWLVSVVLLRRHLRLTMFWALNLFISLYEIWPYLGPDIHAGRWGSVARLPFEPLYLSNVFEGWLFLRYGWVTPIVFRMAFYILWHLLFGGFAAPWFGQ
ncbi:MAG: hypothetical protein QOF24_2708 [Verrucomicrobiota bacterium]|jgi:hypothetical protein